MVYAEDVFILNTILGYIILLLTAKIAKAKASTWRIAVGSVVGGIYAVLIFIPQLSWAYTLLGKFTFVCLQVLLVFGAYRTREYCKTVLVFHFTSFAISGATSGILSAIGMSIVGFPVKILAISTILSFVCITAITNNYRKKANIEQNIGELIIKQGQKEVRVPCLADTGNEAGVAVVECARLKALFPPGFCEDFADSGELELIEKYSLKAMPFTSLGNGGIMLCFTVNGAYFNGVPIKKTIGITRNKLSPTDMYHAIS